LSEINSRQTPKRLQNRAKETPGIIRQFQQAPASLWCQPFPPRMGGRRTSQSKRGSGRETPEHRGLLLLCPLLCTQVGAWSAHCTS